MFLQSHVSKKNPTSPVCNIMIKIHIMNFQTKLMIPLSVLIFGVLFYYYLPEENSLESFPFLIPFCVVVVLCAILVGINYFNENIPEFKPEFRSFQFSYLSVYFCMTFGDWLQGPYVYALYASYGYNIREIGILFVVNSKIQLKLDWFCLLTCFRNFHWLHF
jgi:hypothetical protein